MVVTISAPYGAGGAYVGPRLAERVEVPFVDRAIPNEVAQRLADNDRAREAHKKADMRSP